MFLLNHIRRDDELKPVIDILEEVIERSEQFWAYLKNNPLKDGGFPC